VDFQVRISDPALADFEEILEYSWVNFPATVESFGNALLNHIGLLRTFPYIGSPVGGRPGVRQLVHTPILTYYRVLTSGMRPEVAHNYERAARLDHSKIPSFFPTLRKTSSA
jgi:plasmid stabilization system protein ParE